MIKLIFNYIQDFKKKMDTKRKLKILNNAMVPVKLKTLLGREVISIGPNKWIIRAKTRNFIT